VYILNVECPIISLIDENRIIERRIICFERLLVEFDIVIGVGNRSVGLEMVDFELGWVRGLDGMLGGPLV
jgi:hypothetical protein